MDCTASFCDTQLLYDYNTVIYIYLSSTPEYVYIYATSSHQKHTYPPINTTVCIRATMLHEPKGHKIDAQQMRECYEFMDEVASMHALILPRRWLPCMDVNTEMLYGIGGWEPVVFNELVRLADLDSTVAQFGNLELQQQQHPINRDSGNQGSSRNGGGGRRPQQGQPEFLIRKQQPLQQQEATSSSTSTTTTHRATTRNMNETSWFKNLNSSESTKSTAPTTNSRDKLNAFNAFLEMNPWHHVQPDPVTELQAVPIETKFWAANSFQQTVRTRTHTRAFRELKMKLAITAPLSGMGLSDQVQADGLCKTRLQAGLGQLQPPSNLTEFLWPKATHMLAIASLATTASAVAELNQIVRQLTGLEVGSIFNNSQTHAKMHRLVAMHTHAADWSSRLRLNHDPIKDRKENLKLIPPADGNQFAEDTAKLAATHVAQCAVGDWVEGHWDGDDWYGAVIANISGLDTIPSREEPEPAIILDWDDGEEKWRTLPFEEVAKEGVLCSTLAGQTPVAKPVAAANEGIGLAEEANFIGTSATFWLLDTDRHVHFWGDVGKFVLTPLWWVLDYSETAPVVDGNPEQHVLEGNVERSETEGKQQQQQHQPHQPHQQQHQQQQKAESQKAAHPESGLQLEKNDVYSAATFDVGQAIRQRRQLRFLSRARPSSQKWNPPARSWDGVIVALDHHPAESLAAWAAAEENASIWGNVSEAKMELAKYVDYYNMFTQYWTKQARVGARTVQIISFQSIIASSRGDSGISGASGASGAAGTEVMRLVQMLHEVGGYEMQPPHGGGAGDDGGNGGGGAIGAGIAVSKLLATLLCCPLQHALPRAPAKAARVPEEVMQWLEEATSTSTADMLDAWGEQVLRLGSDVPNLAEHCHKANSAPT